METVKYSVNWDEAASRVEVLVRLLYGALFYAIFIIVFGLLYLLTIALPLGLQFLIVLVTGKRNETISNYLHKYYATYAVNFATYFFLLVDERAPLVPGIAMTSSKVDYAFKEEASRLELLIRLFYFIPLSIVVVILANIAGVAWFVQVLYALATGKKHKALWDLEALYMRYAVNMIYYMFMQTDERPPIMPA